MLTDADIHWYYDTEYKIRREGYEPSPKELAQLRIMKRILKKVRNFKRYNTAIERGELNHKELFN